ncbi:RNA polymerase sigma factor [Flagellimonas sp. S3867]|uniref:RNA polymerase sigma factor n=1 Tax=Flagellimonas sp. S3867 TaxID=2768063 RepID=UPI001688D864|nr:sigma-70 family RNA polymerase sigma factor [Flagellimonas sp. S3867]
MSKDAIDIILWTRFKNGDKNAFETIFKIHYTSLFFYGYKISNSKTLTEDTLQDFFTYLYEKRESLDQVVNIHSYLIVSYRRRLFKALNKRNKDIKKMEKVKKQNQILFYEQELQTDQYTFGTKNSQLVILLNQLPERQKEAIFLKYYNGLTVKEIASIMDISYQSVSNTLQKAFSWLRKKVDHQKLLHILK